MTARCARRGNRVVRPREAGEDPAALHGQRSGVTDACRLYEWAVRTSREGGMYTSVRTPENAPPSISCSISAAARHHNYTHTPCCPPCPQHRTIRVQHSPWYPIILVIACCTCWSLRSFALLSCKVLLTGIVSTRTSKNPSRYIRSNDLYHTKYLQNTTHI